MFQNLGATAGRARGFARLRTLVLPHPTEGRPEAEIRAMVADRLDEIAALISRS